MDIAKVDAIKAALSLPPDIFMPPAAAIGAACEMMSFVPERGTPLPATADTSRALAGKRKHSFSVAEQGEGLGLSKTFVERPPKFLLELSI